MPAHSRLTQGSQVTLNLLRIRVQTGVVDEGVKGMCTPGHASTIREHPRQHATTQSQHAVCGGSLAQRLMKVTLAWHLGPLGAQNAAQSSICKRAARRHVIV